jgi:hypothetical protein
VETRLFHPGDLPETGPEDPAGQGAADSPLLRLGINLCLLIKIFFQKSLLIYVF